MASKSKHTYVFQVSDDGTLKKVKMSAAQAQQELNKVAASSASADRALKGAAQASSNSSKNFSKMAQGITGGLVPAYATLAANIFAISAVFGFFKSAADMTNLLIGQQVMTEKTGIAFQTLTKSVKDASDGMLGFKVAAQGAAIASAAGITGGQLKQLTEIAKNASIVLGRDMEDSFNRVIRGATKAEPELLDELGIILRLEEASKRYAQALNITGRQLTTFEKQQAVTNEIIRQGTNNFGKMSDSSSKTMTSVQRLKASFDELIIMVQGWASKLDPIINFFADNTMALGIALTAMLSGIMKAFIPTIPGFEKMGTAANQARANIARMIDPTSKLGVELEQTGTLSEASMKKLRRSFTAAQSTIVYGSKEQREALLGDLNIFEQAQRQKLRESQSIWKNWRMDVKYNFEKVSEANGKFIGGAIMGVRALGMVFRAIPYLGLAAILFEAGKALYQYFNPIPDHIKEANERTKSFIDTMRTLNKEMASVLGARGTSRSLTEGISQRAGAVGSMDFLGKAQEYKQIKGRGGEEEAKAIKFMGEQIKQLIQLDPRFAKFKNDFKDFLRTGDFKAADAFFNLQQQILGAAQALKALPDMLMQVDQALISIGAKSALTPFDALKKQLTEVSSAGEKGLGEADAEIGAAKNRKLSQYDRREAASTAMNAAREKYKEVEADKYTLGGRQKNQRLAELLEEFNTQKKIHAEAERESQLAFQNEERLTTQKAELKKQIDGQKLILENIMKLEGALNRNAEERRSIEETIAAQRTLGITDAEKLKNLDLDRQQLKIAELTKEDELMIARDALATMESDRAKEGDLFDENKIIAQKQHIANLESQQTILESTNALERQRLDLQKQQVHEAAQQLKMKREEFDMMMAAKYASLDVERARIGGDPAAIRGAQQSEINARLSAAETKQANAAYTYGQMEDNMTAGIARYSPEEMEAARQARENADYDVAQLKVKKTQFEETLATMQAGWDREKEFAEFKANHPAIGPGEILLQQRLNELKNKGIEITDGLIETERERANAMAAVEEMEKRKKDIANSLTSNMESAFMSIVDGSKSAKEAFADMAKAIIKDIAKMIIKMMIYKMIEGTLGKTSFGKSFGLDKLSGSDRYGGIERGYAVGGIAKGPESGYNVRMHGTEAIVPLPNGRSIPVEMKSGSQDTNNVSINVNMAEGNSDQKGGKPGDKGADLGKVLSQAVQDELHKQKRPGGILSPYGAA